MAAPLRGISSMATRQLLAELALACARNTALALEIEAVGGVDAARRVHAGEAFDLVFLAADAIDKLIAAGAVTAGSRVDLVRSPVAVAVRTGSPRPDLASEASLRHALSAGGRIGYSTGPSGNHLLKLFERWGVAAELAGRLVQAPPGVPVGTMLARGDVEIAFQQLSELMNLPGVEVVGPMPPGAQFITTFSGAVCAASTRAEEARSALTFLAAPATADAKRRHGMEPA